MALVVVVGLYLLSRPTDDGDGALVSAAALPGADDAPAAAVELPLVPAPPAAQPIGDAADGAGAPSASRGPPNSPAAGAAPTLADVARPVTLSGRVVDERGSPVAGAEVIHVPSPDVVRALGRKPIPFGPTRPWTEFLRTRTDEQGRFALPTFELPRPADAPLPPLAAGATVQRSEPVPSLAVLHPGFEAALHVCSGYREGDHDVGDIVIVPGCAVAGRLLDEQGAPIPKGAVYASLQSDSADAVRELVWNVLRETLATSSNEEGRFTLDSLWPGPVLLEVVAAGFVPQQIRAECLTGQVTQAGDLVLERGSTIAGVVLDGRGAPLEGVTVKARPTGVDLTHGATDTVAWEFSLIVRSNDRQDVEALSDAQGAFELVALSEPSYTLLAGRDGYEPIKRGDVHPGARGVVLTLAPMASALVTVVDGRSRELLAGASATGRRLAGGSGRVQMDRSMTLDVLTGEPALQAARQAFESRIAGTAGADAPLSSAGLLYVRGLGASRNTLAVGAEGFATTEIELPPAVAEGLVLQDVALVREAAIAGRVVDAAGQAVPSAEIGVVSVQAEAQASPSFPAKPRTETADTEGRFRVGGLAAAEWKLTARAPGFARGEPQVVLVAAEQSVDVTLTLLAGAQITGRVFGPDGRRLPGVSVTAVNASIPPSMPIVELTARGTSHRSDPAARQRSWSVVSGQDGWFALEALGPGRYEVSAGPGAEAAVELEAGGTAELELRQRQQPTIRGRVTDVDGPVADAIVECHERQPDGDWVDATQAESSATGEYELVVPGPGTYLLVAESEGMRAPPRLVVVEWDSPPLQDLAFGTTRVSGRVVAAGSGAPIRKAWVKFRDLSGHERDGLGPNLGHFYASAVKTGDDGRFETSRLQPGRFTIEASGKGFASETRGPLELPAASGEEELLFELAAGATLAGTIEAGATTLSELKVSIAVGGTSGAPAVERTTFVEPDGRYTRGDLPAGPAVVRVLRFTGGPPGGPDPWTVAREQSCVLVAGETTTLDWLISP